MKVVLALGAALIGLSVVGSPAGAETEALDFVRVERQDRGPAHIQDNGGWAAIARNRSELRELWHRYRQSGSFPIIRFEENIAVLAGLGGSGCGTHLHDLRLNRDKERIVARLYREDPGPRYSCTDQYVQETFTVAVNRADLRPLSISSLRVLPRVIEDPDPR